VATAAQVVAGLLGEHEDGSAVARISQDAVAAGRLTREALVEVAAPHAAAYGSQSVAAFVAELLGTTPRRASRVGVR